MSEFYHKVNDEKSYRRAIFLGVSIGLAAICSVWPVMCFKNHSSKEKAKVNKGLAKIERHQRGEGEDENEEEDREHRPRATKPLRGEPKSPKASRRGSGVTSDAQQPPLACDGSGSGPGASTAAPRSSAAETVPSQLLGGSAGAHADVLTEGEESLAYHAACKETTTEQLRSALSAPKASSEVPVAHITPGNDEPSAAAPSPEGSTGTRGSIQSSISTPSSYAEQIRDYRADHRLLDQKYFPHQHVMTVTAAPQRPKPELARNPSYYRPKIVETRSPSASPPQLRQSESMTAAEFIKSLKETPSSNPVSPLRLLPKHAKSSSTDSPDRSSGQHSPLPVPATPASSKAPAKVDANRAVDPPTRPGPSVETTSPPRGQTHSAPSKPSPAKTAADYFTHLPQVVPKRLDFNTKTLSKRRVSNKETSDEGDKQTSPPTLSADSKQDEGFSKRGAFYKVTPPESDPSAPEDSGFGQGVSYFRTFVGSKTTATDPVPEAKHTALVETTASPTPPSRRKSTWHPHEAQSTSAEEAGAPAVRKNSKPGRLSGFKRFLPPGLTIHVTVNNRNSSIAETVRPSEAPRNSSVTDTVRPSKTPPDIEVKKPGERPIQRRFSTATPEFGEQSYSAKRRQLQHSSSSQISPFSESNKYSGFQWTDRPLRSKPSEEAAPHIRPQPAPRSQLPSTLDIIPEPPSRSNSGLQSAAATGPQPNYNQAPVHEEYYKGMLSGPGALTLLPWEKKDDSPSSEEKKLEEQREKAQVAGEKRPSLPQATSSKSRKSSVFQRLRPKQLLARRSRKQSAISIDSKSSAGPTRRHAAPNQGESLAAYVQRVIGPSFDRHNRMSAEAEEPNVKVIKQNPTSARYSTEVTNFRQTSFAQRYRNTKRADEAQAQAYMQAALDDDIEDLQLGFELDVPEHLPNSPLCPANPRHKSGGKAVCPMHGHRKRQAESSVRITAKHEPRIVYEGVAEGVVREGTGTWGRSNSGGQTETVQRAPQNQKTWYS